MKFNKSQFNDDFCDCPDGSDEPGTSACPSGKFYCKNAGHAPLLVYSSRVNDGICDCCDGSDEYDGKVKCPNTCWEVGKVARDKLKKKIATYQEGITLRKKEVEDAKLAIAKEETELSKLKNEEKILKEKVEQLKEQKEQIEKAEEKERLKREKEEKDRKEADDSKLEESKDEEKAEVQEEAARGDIHDKIGVLEDSPSIQEKDATENTESLSKEELGRVVGSRWLGKKSEQETEEVGAGTDTNHDEVLPDTHEEEHNGYDSEVDNHKYDDDESEDQVEDFVGEDHDSSFTYKSESDDDSDFADITTTSSPSWMEKIQQTVKTVFRAVNLFQIPVNISDADHIRKEYDESSAKLTKLQSKISSLTEKLKHDFGQEKEFYSFHGQCFETKQNKYTYKICPFKQASQVEGYSTTRLGNWDKFEDSYKTMLFSSGDHCWNGPDRSIKVKLRCGLKNELTDVDEPSRCEYLAFLSTPALCLEDKLKALQDKLDMMNREQPHGHDEL